MVRAIRDNFERVRHGDKFVVIPCTSEKLNADRLPMTVETGRHDDRGNTVGRAGRVAPAKARSCTAPIVYADLAQQSRVDDRVDAKMVETRSVHP